MTLPGNIGGAVPDGPDWLVRAVRDLQRQVAALATASPALGITPAWLQLTGDDYNLTTSDQVLASQTVSFPAGYRACIVSATGTVGAWNSRTAADTLLGKVGVAFWTSILNLTEVQPSTYGQVTATNSVVVYRDGAAEVFFTGRGWPDGPGANSDGTFNIDVRGATGGASWTHQPSPTNHASLSGVVLFVR